MDLMRKRQAIPRVYMGDGGQERMILLKEEEAAGGSNSAGRPVGP